MLRRLGIRIAVTLAVILSWTAAQAVDNTVILTPGVGVTMRSKDVGSGVESMIQILGDTSGNPIYGTAGAANANVISVQGIGSGTALPISGTVTANAGTNLNTSLLALESGGNLATIAGA